MIYQRPEKLILKVSKKEFVGPDIIKMRFDTDGIKDFTPGQFVTLYINERIRRSYSISSYPGQPFLETYNDITPAGPGSKFFENAVIGQEVIGMFPLGRFVYEQAPGPAIFIATGTGITPIMCMLNAAMKDTNRQLKLIWGTRYLKEIFLKKEIESIKQKIEHFSYQFCITREDSIYFKGRVTHYIESNEFHPESEFYICGGQNMIKDIETILINKGFSKERIKYEQFY